MFLKRDEATITVIVPVYNAMPFLPYSIKSLLEQTEKRIAILLVDDGSTDGSLEYLRALDNPRIYLIEKKNSGIVDTLNLGLKYIETEFTARMDADDICHKTRFEKQLKFLVQNPNHVLVGTSANHIGTSVLSKFMWPIYMPENHSEILKALESRKSAIIHPTIMIRTESLIKVGGYDNEAWPAEDYDLYFRLSTIGYMANIPEHLYSIRLHNRSITAQNIIVSQKKYEMIRQKHIRGNKGKNSNAAVRNLRKFMMNFDYWSVYFYRKGLTQYVNSEKFSGWFILIISIILNPLRSFSYLRRKITNVNFPWLNCEI